VINKSEASPLLSTNSNDQALSPGPVLDTAAPPFPSIEKEKNSPNEKNPKSPVSLHPQEEIKVFSESNSNSESLNEEKKMIGGESSNHELVIALGGKNGILYILDIATGNARDLVCNHSELNNLAFANYLEQNSLYKNLVLTCHKNSSVVL